MNRTALIIGVSVLSYLIGSIPFGLLIAKAFKVGDLRRRGSGNIGTTNVTRVLGFWPAGAITFALDLAKGALPAFLSCSAGQSFWSQFLQLNTDILPLGSSSVIPWLAGLLAVIGHCYSPWLYFKGGKGVATGLGVMLVLSPWAALVGGLAFVIAFANRRVGSLSSIAGVVAASVAHLVLYPIEAYFWLGATLVFLILLRHEENIDALLEERERAFE